MSAYKRSYAVHRLKQVAASYGKLPACHRQMLKYYPKHCEEIAGAIDKNHRFIRAIVHSAVGMFENSSVSNIVSEGFKIVLLFFDQPVYVFYCCAFENNR